MKTQSSQSQSENSALAPDDRAIAIPLEYALGLFVALILIGSLTFTFSAVSDDRAEKATEQEIRRISDEVASGIVSVEALASQGEQLTNEAGTGRPVTAETYVRLPKGISDSSYTVQIIENSGQDYVQVESQGETARTEVNIDAGIETEIAFGGGDLLIVYESNTSPEITVTSSDNP